MDKKKSALGNSASEQQPEKKDFQQGSTAPKKESTTGFTDPGNQTRNEESIDIETEKPAREGRTGDSETIETGGPDKPTA
jgi:hypothetical protein